MARLSQAWLGGRGQNGRGEAGTEGGVRPVGEGTWRGPAGGARLGVERRRMDPQASQGSDGRGVATQPSQGGARLALGRAAQAAQGKACSGRTVDGTAGEASRGRSGTRAIGHGTAGTNRWGL
jgi:hypothetical protein